MIFLSLSLSIKLRANFLNENFHRYFIELEKSSTKELKGPPFDETQNCLMLW